MLYMISRSRSEYFYFWYSAHDSFWQRFSFHVWFSLCGFQVGFGLLHCGSLLTLDDPESCLWIVQLLIVAFIWTSFPATCLPGIWKRRDWSWYGQRLFISLRPEEKQRGCVYIKFVVSLRSELSSISTAAMVTLNLQYLYCCNTVVKLNWFIKICNLQYIVIKDM